MNEKKVYDVEKVPVYSKKNTTFFSINIIKTQEEGDSIRFTFECRGDPKLAKKFLIDRCNRLKGKYATRNRV